MAKKSSGSSAHVGRIKKKGPSTWVTYDSEALLRYFLKEHMEPYGKQDKDEDIDYSDIPELTEERMDKAKRARVGRPPLGVGARKMISLKVDPLVLDQLKRRAKQEHKGYQTLIHEVLEKYLRL